MSPSSSSSARIPGRARRGLVAAVAASGLLLTACGSGGPAGLSTDIAAVVGDREISVEELIATLGLNPPTGDALITAQREALGTLIIEAGFRQIVADRGISIDPQEIDDAIDFQAAAAGLDAAEWLAQVEASQGFTEQRVRDILELQALDSALRDSLFEQIDVDEADLEAEYEARIQQYALATAKHILVATEDEANGIIELLANGADFGELAEGRSLDTGSGGLGGALGTGPVTQYVEEFANAVATAPIGEVVGPVETQFGFHVIVVESREVQTFEDVRGTLRDELAGQELEPLYEAATTSAFIDLMVVVNGRFGKWDSASGPLGAVVDPTFLAPAGNPGAGLGG